MHKTSTQLFARQNQLWHIHLNCAIHFSLFVVVLFRISDNVEPNGDRLHPMSLARSEFLSRHCMTTVAASVHRTCHTGNENFRSNNNNYFPDKWIHNFECNSFSRRRTTNVAENAKARQAMHEEVHFRFCGRLWRNCIENGSYIWFSVWNQRFDYVCRLFGDSRSLGTREKNLE